MSRKTINIADAARYFVYLSYNKRHYSLNTRKLEDVLYMAQGWSYVWDGEPIFGDEFTASTSGPKNAKIENLFGEYRYAEIPESMGANNIKDNDIRETINATWRDFGRKSLRSLNDEIFKQPCYKNANGGPVDNDELKKYYIASYS